MTKGDIDRLTVWRRPVKPLAFFMGLSMLCLFTFNAQDKDVLDGSLWGHLVIAISAVSVVCLGAGWVARSNRMEEIGLIAAVFAWVTRGFTILFMVGAGNIGFWLSLCWAGVAAGAFILESWDANGRGGGK